MIYRFCVWAFACFFALEPVLQAKEKEEQLPAPPPMAQGQNISIYRGRSVQIPLRAAGRAPSQVKFLIRKQPKHGSLGPIEVIDRKNAVVTYTHNEQHGSGGDSFVFAAQVADSPVSAPALISITISEEPVAFSVVHDLDFGKVLLGETREEEVIVRNTGGGVVTGKILAPPPWKLLTVPTYKLARQEEQRIRVLFEPTTDGEVSEHLRFSHDGRVVVALSGTGVAPLKVGPEKEIELRSVPGSTTREARLTIRNVTDRVRTVEVETPAHVVPLPDLTLAPDEEKNVAVRTEDDFIEAIENRITLTSEGYRKEIPLRAYALAPFLEADPQDGFSFGQVQMGRRYKGTLRLKNTGGLAARMTVDFPSGLLLTPDPGMVVIAANETRVFDLTFEPLAVGEISKEIVIRLAQGKDLRIPIRASSVAPATKTEKAPSQIASPALTVSEGKRTDSIAPENSIPPIANVKVLKSYPREIELGWVKPAPEAVGTIVEYREVIPKTEGAPAIVWRPWKGAQFVEENGLTVARFANLPPNGVWYIRISSIDDQDQRSAPSATIKLTPPREDGFHLWWWLAGAALLTLSAIAYRHFRRIRFDESASEAARIAKLEKR